jgi:hypothetical protein
MYKRQYILSCRDKTFSSSAHHDSNTSL